ncbi:MAG: 3D domain-containing protein [Oscillospiraceae bacterium]|nr:3D domain-containing protein [Oscillospiraceae bacterium]
MHDLRIPRETKKTCAILLLAVLLLVAVGSCAGMMFLQTDVAAIDAPTTEREPEMPKQLLAVEEAYTPAVDPGTQTVVANGVECELVPPSESIGAIPLGTFKITHYAPCVECCEKADGISYSGRKVIPYYSVAVDQNVIPLGTILYLDYGDGVLHEVRADDVGGAVKGNVIDL